MVLPARLTALSISAVLLAVAVYLLTQPGDATDVAVPVVAQPTVQPGATLTPVVPARPEVARDEVYVEVYNNSNQHGLAREAAARAQALGWNVVGSDNWYGNIDSSTVYFPPELRRAAQVMAADLGIGRTKAAIAPMRMDRLTVILTGATRR